MIWFEVFIFWIVSVSKLHSSFSDAQEDQTPCQHVEVLYTAMSNIPLIKSLSTRSMRALIFHLFKHYVIRNDEANFKWRKANEHGWRIRFQSEGTQMHIKKAMEIYVVCIGNCDITRIWMWFRTGGPRPMRAPRFRHLCKWVRCNRTCHIRKLLSETFMALCLKDYAFWLFSDLNRLIFCSCRKLSTIAGESFLFPTLIGFVSTGLQRTHDSGREIIKSSLMETIWMI